MRFGQLGSRNSILSVLAQYPELGELLRDEKLKNELDEAFGNGTQVLLEGRKSKDMIGWIIPGDDSLDLSACLERINKLEAVWNNFNCPAFRLDVK